jgi:hypothetical protein
MTDHKPDCHTNYYSTDNSCPRCREEGWIVFGVFVGAIVTLMAVLSVVVLAIKWATGG